MIWLKSKQTVSLSAIHFCNLLKYLGAVPVGSSGGTVAGGKYVPPSQRAGAVTTGMTEVGRRSGAFICMYLCECFCYYCCR
jgi:hypothetical protein